MSECTEAAAAADRTPDGPIGQLDGSGSPRADDSANDGATLLPQPPLPSTPPEVRSAERVAHARTPSVVVDEERLRAWAMASEADEIRELKAMFNAKPLTAEA